VVRLTLAALVTPLPLKNPKKEVAAFATVKLMGAELAGA
jgi:hypothetical protein